jgi:ABC-2 type transport system ATP-binding protein
MSASPIVIENLVKTYNGHTAIKGIELEIRQGEVFGLLGPNGAGKTSTVEILEAYRDRDSGRVEVLGVDPAKPTRAWRSRIGIVLQESGFAQYITARELISLWAAYYPHSRNVDEVIELVGLDDKRNERVKRLSGGQKRRLDLALGIVGDPELIFLDEPTTGFDPSARQQAWQLIRDLRALGKTILLTTHYMDEAQELADRVAVMVGGEIVALGAPNEIGSAELKRTTIRFALPQGVANASLPAFKGTLSQESDYLFVSTDEPVQDANALTSWALTNNYELDGFDVRRPELEAIFLDLVKNDESEPASDE